MQKSVDDAETIEEAITRIVEEHNDSPDAHLGLGQALESHKDEGMIDHPAGSIATDKIAQAKVLLSAFESLDGWLTYTTGTGNIVHDFGTVQLVTGTTSGSDVLLYAVPSAWVPLDWTKSFFWKTTVKLDSDSDQEAFIGIGANPFVGGIDGVGFRVQDDTIDTFLVDNTSYSYESITAPAPNVWNVFEIRYDSTLELLEWYINGTLVRSEDTGLPSNGDDTIAAYSIENDASASKYLYITDFIYQQER